MKDETNTSHHVQMNNGDVAYIRMPGFDRGAKVSKPLSLRELVKHVKGLRT